MLQNPPNSPSFVIQTCPTPWRSAQRFDVKAVYTSGNDASFSAISKSENRS